MDYKKLLTKVGIISEEEFNDIISNCPKIQDEETFMLNIDIDCITDINDFTSSIIDDWLSDNTKYAWGEDINFKNKTLFIYDYDSLDEAELVKNILESYGWKILNFQEEIENIENENDNRIKNNYLEKLSKLSTEDLKDICDKL